MSVILVTGGNQGLGLALIEELATHDKTYKIVLTARNVESGKKAVAELHGKGHNNVSFIQLDVTDDTSIEQAYIEVEKDFGKVDTFVLNAAISSTDLPVRESYAKIYDTNVVSNVILLKKFKPLVYKSLKPRVLFISSGFGSLDIMSREIYGPYPVDVAVPYGATKSALNYAMLSFKTEWKEVKFGAIDPGYCATNLNAYKGIKTPIQGVKAAFTAIVNDNEWESGQFLQLEPGQDSLTIVPW